MKKLQNITTGLLTRFLVFCYQSILGTFRYYSFPDYKTPTKS